ncbi:MAG TPA: ABC transporter permease, partial [Clostridia bacterium]|nr:ABC transporter permease [Clostridia bacterium]
MKSYKQITYRYLKEQRNRTLLTILGIILSLAMISAIGSIMVAAKDRAIQDTLENAGSYHGQFTDVSQSQIQQLTNHVDVDEVGVRELKNYATVSQVTQEERDNRNVVYPYRYLEIKAYDEKALSFLPLHLKEGRFPENDQEIALEDWVLEYFDEDYALGDTIKLNLGDRDTSYGEDADGYTIMTEETFIQEGEGSYTLVGITQPKRRWSGAFISDAIVGSRLSMQENRNYNAFFTLSDIKNAPAKIARIAKDIGVSKDNTFYNEGLLRLYGQSIHESFNSSIMALVLFVIGLIMVSTIAVIYNSFHISALERTSQFGILRSVGATPKQIRGIVLKEAGTLSLIGIPIGLFSGILAMKVVFYVISLLQGDLDVLTNMTITISPTVLVLGAGVGGITVFLSALGPAIKAGRISPLEAVRNTGDLKLEPFKKVKTAKLTQKIFGIEGSIARKNLGRNKKRFFITV